uniref:L,D-transpeptidase family protein n=1 Tax=Streptomyces sulfonofaciens TaxID=68272 RepID=UPI003570D05B
MACGALLATLVSCGHAKDTSAPKNRASSDKTEHARAQSAGLDRIPDVGERLQSRIPAESRQVVAVYGKGPDSADSTVSLFSKRSDGWHKTRTWSGHNGRKGWARPHHVDDKRSPVGVFTLSDAGGVLPDPGAKLPYTSSAAFQAPSFWGKTYQHDFDYVIAIDYNRVKGTPPNDPTRPQGYAKGGSIWLHMDHGSGTTGCVSVSKSAMEYLLRTLDPGRHPVVVMGDTANLQS